MYYSPGHQAWNIVETQNYLLNKWTGKTMEVLCTLLPWSLLQKSEKILLLDFIINELPSTLPAGMLSNGSFTEKRETDRDMLSFYSPSWKQANHGFSNPNYHKHPKFTKNVRGFQGQSGELESPVQVNVTDSFLFCFLEFLISLCSEDPC